MTLKLTTKEKILKKVKESDTDWFLEDKYFQGKPLDRDSWEAKDWIAFDKRRSTNTLLVEEQEEENVRSSVEGVQSYNDGDGNCQYKTLYFKPYDLYVSLVGTYSSWGEGSWDDVFVSEPYIHTETRYKKKEG